MLRKLLVATLIFLSGVAARAQAISIYATSSSAHLSNAQTGDVVTSNGAGFSFAERYGSFWTSGVGGGVTLNFLPVGPVRLGLDLRGSTRPGTVGADTAMAGFKVGFNPLLLKLKPYVQASAGYVGTRTVNTSNVSGTSTQTVGGTFTNRYIAWEILGGIDYPWARVLDFRIVEVGGGMGYDVFGAANSNLSLFTVNSGLVLHF